MKALRSNPFNTNGPLRSDRAAGKFSGRVSALPKVVFTVFFLILTVSFDRCDWIGCAGFAAAPLLLAEWFGVSIRMLLRRIAAALPFVLCAGAANCFFDRAETTFLPGVTISVGQLALVVLLEKTAAAVGMVGLLAATTSLSGVTGALRALKVPCVLILQLELMLRYMGLLYEELRRAVSAYTLRNPLEKSIRFRDLGGLLGRLFLRSIQRANAVYAAMQCRLFHAGAPLPRTETGRTGEWLKIIGAGIFFLGVRIGL